MGVQGEIYSGPHIQDSFGVNLSYTAIASTGSESLPTAPSSLFWWPVSWYSAWASRPTTSRRRSSHRVGWHWPRPGPRWRQPGSSTRKIPRPVGPLPATVAATPGDPAGRKPPVLNPGMPESQAKHRSALNRVMYMLVLLIAAVSSGGCATTDPKSNCSFILDELASLEDILNNPRSYRVCPSDTAKDRSE